MRGKQTKKFVPFRPSFLARLALARHFSSPALFFYLPVLGLARERAGQSAAAIVPFVSFLGIIDSAHNRATATPNSTDPRMDRRLTQVTSGRIVRLIVGRFYIAVSPAARIEGSLHVRARFHSRAPSRLKRELSANARRKKEHAKGIYFERLHLTGGIRPELEVILFRLPEVFLEARNATRGA